MFRKRTRPKPCKLGHTETFPDGSCKECNRIAKAKSRGAVQFKPCVNGHTTGRDRAGNCRGCQRMWKGATARGTVDRVDRPCVYGHTSGRYPSGDCKDCDRERRGMVEGRKPQPCQGEFMPHPLIKKLRATRKKRGLTQRELETQAGVSEKMVSRMENGAGQVRILGSLGQVAAALGFKLVLIPRAYREHSQYTINMASAAVCSVCATGLDVERQAGAWVHRVQGKAVTCYASAIREALFEPVTDKETDLLKHYRDTDDRRKQQKGIKEEKAKTKSDEAERKVAQRKLSAAAALAELRS